MDKETELLIMLSKPKVRLQVFTHSSVSIVDRKSEWNNRYKKLNISQESKERLLNSCYIDIFDKYLDLSKNKNKLPRVLELACGSAPFTKRALNNNAHAVATDYSEIIINRLKKEYKYEAYVEDLWKINKSIGKFDIIVIAGGIYESDDYTLPKCLYSQLYEMLSDEGVILQFLNRYDNFANRLMVLNAKIRQLIKLSNYNFIRKLFKKKPIQKYHLFWLMSPKYICNSGTQNNLEVIETLPLRLINGILDSFLWGLYPFNFFPFKNSSLYSQDSAEKNKDKIFSKFFLFIHNYIFKRKKLRHMFSMSYCVVFKKKLSKNFDSQ